MEYTVSSSSLNQSEIIGLIDSSNMKESLIEGYENLIKGYKSLPSKQSKHIRQLFQKKYNIPFEALATEGNKFDTNKIKESKDLKDSILKVTDTFGIFLVKNASKNAVFCVVNLNTLFPKVESIGKNIKETKEVDTKEVDTKRQTKK